jgi:uncharacterized protein YbbC (DUF1343 family)
MKNSIFTFFFLLITLPVLAMDYGIDRLSGTDIQNTLKQREHLIDLLHKDFELKKIFAPEHGLRTMADDWIEDGTDEQTGLPVISLYKRTSKGPTPKDLIGIDAIVIDLQDVGVRYYTYFSTIAEVMKAASPLNVEIILLDRPNLIGGKIIEGKVLDSNLTGSFTAYHTVPTRHGMTLGELARMINHEKDMKVKLTVIPVSGWERENLVFNMDREWIAPSPALIDIEQVGLYAMWGTLENFNLAVGRGKENDLAFRVLGAPWITKEESKKLTNELNAFGFKGVKFESFEWKVTRATHVGQTARGVKIFWDGSEVRTDEFTYKTAQTLVKLFKGRINSDKMSPQSYGSLTMVNAIRNGTPWSDYVKVIDKELESFKIRRIPFLLY